MNPHDADGGDVTEDILGIGYSEEALRRAEEDEERSESEYEAAA